MSRGEWKYVYTQREVAEWGGVSREELRRARRRGELDIGDLESVVRWLLGRDGPFRRLVMVELMGSNSPRTG